MYWKNRQEQQKKAAMKSEEALKKRLSDFYTKEAKKLQKEIQSFYAEYGKDNVIEYRILMEKLSDADRDLLFEDMDSFTKKYPQYAHLIPTRENIYKLNRLEGLQHSILMQQYEIGAIEIEEITKHLDNVAEYCYTDALKAMGASFNTVSKDILKQFVDVDWTGEGNYSSSIWKNKKKLAKYINQDLSQALARGDSYKKLIKNLTERFGNVSRNDAYRLIYTEGTYVMAESSIQPFVESFTKYKLSPVLDDRTCPICRGLIDVVTDIKDRQTGVNFPPLHPWCRCSWEIVVDDWNAWEEEYVKTHTKEQAEKIRGNLS